MGDSTGIQWTDATWTPLRARRHDDGVRDGWACVRVSPGCVNCYAATLNESQRFGRGTGLDYTVPSLAKVEHYLHEETLTQPLRWKKPRRIFVCSMTDIFGEWVTDEWLDRIFAVMALTPQHTYQVLTKRPERMRAYLTGEWRAVRVLDTARAIADSIDELAWPLPNIWLGVSVEDQERADERIPLLLDTPAAVRFLSCEPLLEEVDIAIGACVHCRGRRWTDDENSIEGARLPCGACNPGGWDVPDIERPQIDWVIVGGESGAGARPFDLAWARSLVQQCRAAGVAPFVKQLGSHVLDRNDAGFDGDDEDDWPEEMRTSGWYDSMYQGENVRVHLRHTHGGNPDEWPEDLRVREWPASAEAVAR